MGAIKENVSKQRTLYAVNSAVGADVEVLSGYIDTAGYEGGIYVSAYLSARSAGGATMVIKHSDTTGGTFTAVDQSNLVYGRNDGLLPFFDAETTPSNTVGIAREGIVGQKRYIKVGFLGNSSANSIIGVAMVTLTSELIPIESDADYS